MVRRCVKDAYLCYRELGKGAFGVLVIKTHISVTGSWGRVRSARCTRAI